jgi:hypothetical protein
MNRKNRSVKGWVIVVAFLVVISGLLAADVRAGECENALFRCMDDPYWHMTLAGPVYCATGYLFCKKYVEG